MDKKRLQLALNTFMVLLIAVTAPVADAADRVLTIRGVEHPGETAAGENTVHHRCLTPVPGRTIDLGLERDNPWSLPDQALSADTAVTIRCLVLRFNFQEEVTDDPNTTGNGLMNLSNPLASFEDSAAYYDSVGHWIDPPPHDAAYFGAHMQALSRYYEVVSDGRITLAWDVYPSAPDSVYQLPQPMSHYGRCDFADVVEGLEEYFLDCIQLADTASPDIEWSNYQSIFLFHAGSDRQNDIGFPTTCNDLFTGYISFREQVPVDGALTGDTTVSTALMMPETASQDNRATALNAVMAHEFGHQLGLVDLYSTRTFMSQLGDFALMDNNGFGTGVDFGFDAGRVFGSIPLFPCAWSRAHVGFVDVHDFRKGTGIELAAAQMAEEGIRVARIPISENEYYLLENRLIEYDGIETGVKQDPNTSVIQGPVQILFENGQPVAGDLTREYDALMPGSGMLVFHVDEGVAGLDYNGDGEDNFRDNQLQWDPERKFITLIEADGVINFGGYYRAGYGSPEDMYRDDRATSFTPNTNPPTIDNSGNNTHIRVTGISRVIDTLGTQLVIRDSLMRFDVETENLVDGFPVRAGAPFIPLSPVADDLNRDGTKEIIFASDRRLLVVTSSGESFLRKFIGNENTPVYYDTAIASIHPGRIHPVPLYFETPFSPSIPAYIAAGPVTGDFGQENGEKFIAISYAPNALRLLRPADNDDNGIADYAASHTLNGTPRALIFGDVLFALTDRGYIYVKRAVSDRPSEIGLVPVSSGAEYHGICRAGNGIILMAGDSSITRFYHVTKDTLVDSLRVEGYYRYGPILVDMNRDDVPEVVGISPEGDIVLVSADTTVSPAILSVHRQGSIGWPVTTYPGTGDTRQGSIGWRVTTNPVAGDIDGDGYPDLVMGGVNTILAVNRELNLLMDFPIMVDDRYPGGDVISPPIVAGIDRGGRPEICFPTAWGNIYSYGERLTFGFPLSGGELGVGSPVALADSLGGMIGYLGADGWFYLWQSDEDSAANYWPMGGADPTGSLAFDPSRLGPIKSFATALDEDRFFNYPNPVTDGATTINYFLGVPAARAEITIYDLSGQEIESFSGPTSGGVDNRFVWNCAGVTPGVYRCRLEVDFGDMTETAFTDIAIIK